MDTSPWSAQQLARFLAAVSAYAREDGAIRGGIELAAEAFEAEAGVVCYGPRVVATVGFPEGRLPVAEIVGVLETGSMLAVPGAGLCHTLRVPVAADLDGDECVMLLARSDQAFSREESSLLRAMGTGLGLTLGHLRSMESLRKRQVTLERLSAIQRAISLRQPLTKIFEDITAGAAELMDEPIAGLYLVDAEDPRSLVSASVHEGPLAGHLTASKLTVGKGVVGRSVVEDRLIVVEGYAGHPDADRRAQRMGLEATMAAPIRDSTRVAGTLVVGSLTAGRTYSQSERDLLLAFAELAGLAVTDAHTVEALHEAVGSATHRALHDALTGLGNRTRFLDRLEHALAQRRLPGSLVAVLYVDIDDFKLVNDRFGHSVGDQMIVEVAGRLSAAVRGGDTVARLGGDEFAVLIEQATGMAEATAVAERVLGALRVPVRLVGVEMSCNASVGVAGEVGNEWSAEELLRNADVAMYQAKNSGKGCAVVFQPEMYEALLDRLELETDLRKLVADDEVAVRFQPIVHLDDGRVMGVEALARWTHAERGPIPPSTFIPLAESTGLIVPLGRRILEHACAWAGRWRAVNPGSELVLSVNLSSRQLQDPELVGSVVRALTEAGLEARCLVLEITESVLMQDTELTISRLKQLKDVGVRIALDDFGTGYSSLSYLRRFPVDMLKIDRSFVSALRTGDELCRLTEAIIALGNALGLECLAEGIETAEELDALRQLGCELGQGLYFAGPMAVPELEEYLWSPQPDPSAAAMRLAP